MALANRFRQFLGSKRVAVLEACVIGLVSGLTAVVLKQGVDWMGGWRTAQSTHLWLLLPGMGLLGGYLAGWVIVWGAPTSGGSGIPQVKAALAYVGMPLNLRLAIAKIGGTLLALGSGLSLGRQGPTVQIGAALAAQLSRWVPTSPEHRRQLMAAGAAAGLAAGFNAPIAGVLFVVEELLQDFSGLTLGTAILASFIGAVVSRVLGGQGLNLSISGFQTGLSLTDLPFLGLLGVLAGLLGALFSHGIFASLNFFKQQVKLSLPWRIGLTGLLTGVVGLFLPVAAQDNTGLREFLVTGEAGWQIIALAFVTKFGLTLLAYGSGAPGGIFAPALVLGSALGCLVSFLAQGVHQWWGFASGTVDLGNTTTYALSGMGAFFCAVTGVPITAIVIVFEMTANFNLVLPLMICSGVAYLTADRVASGSIYTRLLDWQGIHLEPTPSENNPWATLRAADIMQSRVETLSSDLPVSEVVEAFSRSHHRGFPVIDQGRLVGIVTQADLRRPAPDATVAAIMTPHPVTIAPDAPLMAVLHLLNQWKVSRIPVVEGHKLVGIITRGDIIRAESDQVSGKILDRGPQSEPSYPVYQTRGPATGQGRLLVPLSDPRTAPLLLRLAGAIAAEHRYELECIHIFPVARSQSPSETTVDWTHHLPLLQQAQRIGQAYGVPVHTQIRLAHDVAYTLLETIKERHINLILMGWQRQKNTPGRIFGTVVDTLIRQAPCHVVLVRPTETMGLHRWLMPVAGGPNAAKALELLPALVKMAQPERLHLCHVQPPPAAETNSCPLPVVSPETDSCLNQAIAQLSPKLQRQVKLLNLVSEHVADTVIKAAQDTESDVILLGASREGMLSHVLHGNIPIAIAQYSAATTILVRSAD